jgi:hypothetical protein
VRDIKRWRDAVSRPSSDISSHAMPLPTSMLLNLRQAGFDDLALRTSATKVGSQRSPDGLRRRPAQTKSTPGKACFNVYITAGASRPHVGFNVKGQRSKEPVVAPWLYSPLPELPQENFKWSRSLKVVRIDRSPSTHRRRGITEPYPMRATQRFPIPTQGGRAFRQIPTHSFRRGDRRTMP